MPPTAAGLARAVDGLAERIRLADAIVALPRVGAEVLAAEERAGVAARGGAHQHEHLYGVLYPKAGGPRKLLP